MSHILNNKKYDDTKMQQTNTYLRAISFMLLSMFFPSYDIIHTL